MDEFKSMSIKTIYIEKIEKNGEWKTKQNKTEMCVKKLWDNIKEFKP